MSYPYQPREKWDVHTHTTLSPATYERLGKFTSYADFVRVRAHGAKPCCADMVNSEGRVLRVVEDNAYDGAVRMRECDAHGVTMQVLSPTPMMIPDYVDDAADAAEICRILNDDNAGTVAKFPGRFLALGALPLRHPDEAIRELERIKGMGLRGIEINSNVDGHDLDDPRFFPVFQAAAALDMALFIHPWGGFMKPEGEKFTRRMRPDYNWRPWLIGMGLETALAFDSMRCGRVHERLPHLRVMYAHGGGAFTGLIGRMDHGAWCRPDLFPEKAKLNPFRTVRECGVYVDSLTHAPWVFETLVRTIGVSRIAMGSDYPYPLGEIDNPDNPRGLYPGYMIEHLPDADTPMAEAWKYFPWIPDTDAGGGPRALPCLNDMQRERLLAGTAKEWLGLGLAA